MGSQTRPTSLRPVLIGSLAAGSTILALLACCASAIAIGPRTPERSQSVATAAEAGLSTSVRAQLLKDAKQVAARAPYGYHHPSDIAVLLTTETKAWSLENEARKVDVPCASCGAASVYLVALRGVSSDCHEKPGELQTCSTHPPVLMFWVSPTTLKLSRTARGSAYPNLSTVGTPVSLE